MEYAHTTSLPLAQRLLQYQISPRAIPSRADAAPMIAVRGNARRSSDRAGSRTSTIYWGVGMLGARWTRDHTRTGGTNTVSRAMNTPSTHAYRNGASGTSPC